MSDSNPDASPVSQADIPIPVTSTSGMDPEQLRDYLRKVASRQKWVLFCLLGRIIFAAIGFLTAQSIPQAAALALLVSEIIVLVLTLASILSLARILQGTVAGVMALIFSFVPLFSIFIMLYYNHHATKELRQAGIPVGLMGAKLKEI